MTNGFSREPADLAALDLTAVSPEEFARTVEGLSTGEITGIMRGEPRMRVLDEVFRRVERHFRPERAGSPEAAVRWRITGETEVVREIAISGGVCTVREGCGETDPRVTLTMGDAEFLRLVSGNASPVTVFTARRLKPAGDVGLASGLTRYFDIPGA